MNANMLKEENLSIIDYADIDTVNIKEEICKAALGVVFIRSGRRIIGWISLDQYVLNMNKKTREMVRNDYFPHVSAFENVPERIRELVLLNPYLSCIPVLDENGQLLYAVKCISDKWLCEEYKCLQTFLDDKEYYSAKGVPCYCNEKNIKKVAIYGINSLAVQMTRIYRSDIEIHIIENSRTKMVCDVNVINEKDNITFVDSLEEYVEENKIDCVIVAEWSYRNLQKCNLGFPCIWVGDFVKKVLPPYQVEYLRQKEGLSLQEEGITLETVAIPNESELGIGVKPRGNALDWYTWFAEEIDGSIDDGKAFMQMRMESSKNISKTAETRCLGDYESKYINIKGGCRVVSNFNYEAENTIYLIGPCIVSGQFNKDEFTLGSCLQRSLNKSGLSYNVVCIATPNDVERIWYFSALHRFKLKAGDKVFWLETSKKLLHQDINLKDIYAKLLKECGDTFYFDFLMHVGKRGTDRIAAVITRQILSAGKSHFESYSYLNGNREEKTEGMASELKNYLQSIKKGSFFGELKIGAIVMNCNPFTLGHRYLIEFASKQVDYLYVFVVEEDKSYFKFVDRIEMVKQGTADLRNVMVFPSGQYMISQNTFSEYFIKDTVQKRIDASLDVEIFGRYIAPELGISIRFLGEEPLDIVTKQYNEILKRVLPGYGVEVLEIKRLETKGEIVSASRVRKYLMENKWDDIKQIVPKTTYQYLKECIRCQQEVGHGGSC